MVKNIYLLILFVAISFNASAQNYLLGNSKDGIEELYIMSITTNKAKSTIMVFDRVKPVEGRLQDFRKNALRSVDKEKVEIPELDKLAYYRRKMQYSCAARKYRIMECTYYDIGGKVLQKAEYDDEHTLWLPIPGGTLIEAEFQKGCNRK